jgi:murein DD-endopeptidase MepM/ murein hydrolase activator NlpD
MNKLLKLLLIISFVFVATAEAGPQDRQQYPVMNFWSMNSDQLLKALVNTSFSGNRGLVVHASTQQAHPSLYALPSAPIPHAKDVSIPVDGSISSSFGYRKHPIYRSIRHHRGVDIKANRGAPVRAVMAGKVEFAAYSGGYGRLVKIIHPGRYNETRYAHLASISVKEGQIVQRGEIIGLTGRSGRTTGYHLHFELYKDGRAIDPEQYMVQY